MELNKINKNKFLVEKLLILFPVSLIFFPLFSEVIILFLILFCLFDIKKNILFDYLKDPIIIFLILFWVYLNINYLINFENSPSLLRTIFFGRFILLILSIIYFINYQKINLNKIINFWLILIIIICCDLLVQFYFGKNIFGYQSIQIENINRLGGFLNDELKIANFIFHFGFLVFAHNYAKEKQYQSTNFYNLFYLLLILVCIFITGERSNFLTTLIFVILFLFFTDNKKFYISSVSFFIISFLIIINYFHKDLTSRMLFNIAKNIDILKIEENKSFLNKNSHHFAHYSTAYQIFERNKLFGVGIKNFRNFCDKDEFNKDIYKGWEDRKCATHPHNFYFEILSELGLVGLILIAIFFIIMFMKVFKMILKTKDKFLIINFLIVLVYFVPFMPKGSFFTTWNAMIFWFLISFLIANYFRLKN